MSEPRSEASLIFPLYLLLEILAECSFVSMSRKIRDSSIVTCIYSVFIMVKDKACSVGPEVSTIGRLRWTIWRRRLPEGLKEPPPIPVSSTPAL